MSTAIPQRKPTLTNKEQLWLMQQVKTRTMSIEEALSWTEMRENELQTQDDDNAITTSKRKSTTLKTKKKSFRKGRALKSFLVKKQTGRKQETDKSASPRQGIHDASSFPKDLRNKQTYNFSIYKCSKHKAPQKRILQIDFDSKLITMIQHGNIVKVHPFSSLDNVDGEEGKKVFIYFDNSQEIELSAENLSDKTKLLRLLNIIIEKNNYEESGQPYNPCDKLESSFKVIKEGFLEKKGNHPASNWNKRHVVIRSGELAYYRLDEEEKSAALNIIHLSPGSIAINSEESNTFNIATTKENYRFRVPEGTAMLPCVQEQIRDHWIQAIHDGCNKHISDFDLASSSESKEFQQQQENQYNDSYNTIYKELAKVKEAQTNSTTTNANNLKQIERMLEILEELYPINKQISQKNLSPSLIDEEKFSKNLDGKQQNKNILRDSNQHSIYNSFNPDRLSLEVEIRITNIDDILDTSDSLRDTISIPDVFVTVPNDHNEEKEVAIDNMIIKNANLQESIGDGVSSSEASLVENKIAELFTQATLGTKSQLETKRLSLSAQSSRHSSVASLIEYHEKTFDINVADIPPPPKIMSTFLKDNEGAFDDMPPPPPLPNLTGLLSDSSQQPQIDNKLQPIEDDCIPPAPPVFTLPPPPPSILPVSSSSPVADEINLNAPKKKPMRPFHWAPVPQKLISKSMWENVENVNDKIDVEFLHTMFHVTNDKSKLTLEDHNTPSRVILPKNATLKKKQSETYLDRKTAQNLGIFLAGFRIRGDELRKRVMIVKEEDGGLKTEQVAGLLKFCPEPEMKDLYAKHQGKEDELSKEDRFIAELCQIPRLNLRLETISIVRQIPQEIDALLPEIELVLKACQELLQSKLFESLLTYLLAVTNHVNSTNSKGVTKGIRLSSLEKTSVMRTSDRKLTLLQVLLEIIKKEKPGIFQLEKELHSFSKPQSYSVKGLLAETDVMRKTAVKAKKNSEVFKRKKNDSSDEDLTFCFNVEAELCLLDSRVNLMVEKCLEVKTTYNKILVKFGESPQTDWQELYGWVRDFLENFKKSLPL